MLYKPGNWSFLYLLTERNSRIVPLLFIEDLVCYRRSLISIHYHYLMTLMGLLSLYKMPQKDVKLWLICYGRSLFSVSFFWLFFFNHLCFCFHYLITNLILQHFHYITSSFMVLYYEVIKVSNLFSFMLLIINRY